MRSRRSRCSGILKQSTSENVFIEETSRQEFSMWIDVRVFGGGEVEEQKSKTIRSGLPPFHSKIHGGLFIDYIIT